jgi:acyl-CoA hydrolase
MDGLTEYKNKLVSLKEAVGKIQSSQTVCVAMAGAEPPGLLTTLAGERDRLQNVTLWTCLPMRAYDIFLKPEMEGPFFNENWFYGAADRKVHPEGRVSYTPNNLHLASADKLYATKNHVGVFIGTATPPDKRGFMSLSLGNVYEKEMIAAAGLVILEINQNLPWTFGDTQVHISEVDLVVENHVALVELPSEPPSEIEQSIGGHIANLIEDGATLQLGIGGIPNAIASFLTDRKDLGLHTEMFVDGMVDLYEAGILTNRRKTLHPGKMIATFALGTQKLYDFLDHNVSVEILRGRYVNDPYVVGKNYKMVSVNTAIQVDVIGQVCSQSIGTRQFSGTGGQLDTHRGAQLSEGGRGIIALRSTAKNGTISTIVPTLAPGSGVTVPSQDIDTIVTEFGVAELRGRCIRDRMEALIKIAHPNFRDWIREEAHALGIVPDKRYFKGG